jgi:hypothetical protein
VASSAPVAPRSTRIAVYLEAGRSRTFACALDWPGWCRTARGEEAALQMLADYAPRYAPVATRAQLTLPGVDVAGFEVVETVQGDATTDFGAPSVIPALDMRALTTREARREVALLDAAWAELDSVVASSPAALRKGPRGGGRDRDAMVSHVVEAERAYARKVGVRLTAQEWRDGGVELMRARLRDVLATASAGSAPVERGWPPRYAARRIAWHVLDHAWEMQDRSSRPPRHARGGAGGGT